MLITEGLRRLCRRSSRSEPNASLHLKAAGAVGVAGRQRRHEAGRSWCYRTVIPHKTGRTGILAADNSADRQPCPIFVFAAFRKYATKSHGTGWAA
jgi:hypothetical protein